jgi:hypothetical protein
MKFDHDKSKKIQPQEIKKNLMKARHFLQVSSEIIGKHRHRSDVTGMTSSTDLQIAATSTTNQAKAPSYLLGYSEAETMSAPAILRTGLQAGKHVSLYQERI